MQEWLVSLVVAEPEQDGAKVRAGEVAFAMVFGVHAEDGLVEMITAIKDWLADSLKAGAFDAAISQLAAKLQKEAEAEENASVQGTMSDELYQQLRNVLGGMPE